MTTEKEIIARLKPGCICKGIKLHEIMHAIEQGASSFAEISQIIGIGGGSCKSRRCKPKVTELLTGKTEASDNDRKSGV